MKLSSRRTDKGGDSNGRLVAARAVEKLPLTYRFLSAPGRNRTYDTRFRKPLLYPLSYGGKGR